jgi:hypothetical protein
VHHVWPITLQDTTALHRDTFALSTMPATQRIFGLHQSQMTPKYECGVEAGFRNNLKGVSSRKTRRYFVFTGNLYLDAIV